MLCVLHAVLCLSLIKSSRCIANGSSLRALLQVLVGLEITSKVELILTKLAALYSVGGIRATFTIGVGAGGPAAYW
jgi:hypothetical protein